jgi:hypothetical protein
MTYDWIRNLPENTSKYEHYNTFAALIKDITKDIEGEITCECHHTITPVLMFLTGFNKHFPAPEYGRYLFGTLSDIKFYVDPEIQDKTVIVFADDVLVTKINLIQDWD